MNAFIKRDWGPAQSFERHRARNVSELGQLFRTMKREGANRAHCLRSVQQRETFFYF
jgi:hypothetical protein